MNEDDDDARLERLGYRPELARVLGGFGNFAVSLSIICILAGGVTSFHIGLCAAGPAGVALGWPLACLYSLVVAAAMAMVASAFPTAGGLYHWAAVLGGRGWGWATAWLNLAGLVAVLAAINVGAARFIAQSLGPPLGVEPAAWSPAASMAVQLAAMATITGLQALVNIRGLRLTGRLTAFSGWWILGVSVTLTVAVLGTAPAWHFERLVEFHNYSGEAGGKVWPATASLPLLFLLGLMLPAYTITGFDASAHLSEETRDAARQAPRALVRSVAVSAVFGWLFLAALLVAVRDMDAVAAAGDGAFPAALRQCLPPIAANLLLAAIGVAQLLCGLATVTSASRMAFAFARDGGPPGSAWLRRVSGNQVPANAVVAVSVAAVLLTVWTPVYDTIAAICAILLYCSYVLPIALGAMAWGRTWTTPGPWSLGRWFRPAAAASVLGGVVLAGIGMAPPNEKAALVVGALLLFLAFRWTLVDRKTFVGPPMGVG